MNVMLSIVGVVVGLAVGKIGVQPARKIMIKMMRNDDERCNINSPEIKNWFELVARKQLLLQTR
jgi:uncharacterized protein YneF (UPF0154 family)